MLLCFMCLKRRKVNERSQKGFLKLLKIFALSDALAIVLICFSSMVDRNSGWVIYKSNKAIPLLLGNNRKELLYLDEDSLIAESSPAKQ